MKTAPVQSEHSSTERSNTSFLAFGIRRSKGDKVLDCWFPFIIPNSDIPSEWSHWITDTGRRLTTEDCEKIKDRIPTIQTLLDKTETPYGISEPIMWAIPRLDQPIESVESAYLKLHLLSTRHVKPHGASLAGLFGTLTNIAWTNIGPVLPEDLDEVRLNLWGQTELVVSHVDKFPYLVNYHVPSGVRIASGSQVRLGAYLGSGTTVMPAGYINFNAGTMGNAMIEGRISAGVVVDDHSDVGGGASIMGTLSGGNETVISIGSQCLLGANSGTGISLGNGCTIAAGLYIYAGMKIRCYNQNNDPINAENKSVPEGQNIVKASELSGRDYTLFIQDSVTGHVICKPNLKVIELNEELHKN